MKTLTKSESMPSPKALKQINRVNTALQIVNAVACDPKAVIAQENQEAQAKALKVETKSEKQLKPVTPPAPAPASKEVVAEAPAVTEENKLEENKLVESIKALSGRIGDFIKLTATLTRVEKTLNGQNISNEDLAKALVMINSEVSNIKDDIYSLKSFLPNFDQHQSSGQEKLGKNKKVAGDKTVTIKDNSTFIGMGILLVCIVSIFFYINYNLNEMKTTLNNLNPTISNSNNSSSRAEVPITQPNSSSNPKTTSKKK